jgi:hypothetical protein
MQPDRDDEGRYALVQRLLPTFEEALWDPFDLGLAVFVRDGREEQGVRVVVRAVDLSASALLRLDADRVGGSPPLRRCWCWCVRTHGEGEGPA